MKKRKKDEKSVEEGQFWLRSYTLDEYRSRLMDLNDLIGDEEKVSIPSPKELLENKKIPQPRKK